MTSVTPAENCQSAAVLEDTSMARGDTSDGPNGVLMLAADDQSETSEVSKATGTTAEATEGDDGADHGKQDENLASATSGDTAQEEGVGASPESLGGTREGGDYQDSNETTEPDETEGQNEAEGGDAPSSGVVESSEAEGAGAAQTNDVAERSQTEEPNETGSGNSPTSEVVNVLTSLLTSGAVERKNETLADKTVQFLDDFGIVHRKRQDLPDQRTVFSFGTQLQNCNLDNRIDVREPKKLVALYSISPLRVPEDHRMAAMEFFTRANYDLLNGGFEFDMRDGEFRYKVCANFVGADISLETIRYMYLVAANTMSRYFNGIMKIVYCGKGPIDAIRDCEAPVPQAPSSPQQ